MPPGARFAKRLLLCALAGCQPSGERQTTAQPPRSAPHPPAAAPLPPRQAPPTPAPGLTVFTPLREIERGVYDVSASLADRVCPEAKLITAIQDLRPTWADGSDINKIEIQLLKPGHCVVRSVRQTPDGGTEQRQLRLEVAPGVPPGQAHYIAGIAFAPDDSRRVAQHDRIIFTWSGVGGRRPAWADSYAWTLDGVTYLANVK